ncbi:hypothetical protein [uncultured Thiodictyon sp.]|uniref:helix-turn-helix transcriptional regulator n=1 Tax=uncultured Thiodictyon sp. TaxID=1846217 RepID=UPI0025CEB34A|nr:hypothetical protein [uncultured Thiodictyon sp.]
MHNTASELWDATEVAAYFKIAIDTLYRRRSRYPESLPPAAKIGRRLLWDPALVREWRRRRTEDVTR